MASLFCDDNPTRLRAYRPENLTDRRLLGELVEASKQDTGDDADWRLACASYAVGYNGAASDMRERAAQAASDASVLANQEDIADLIRALPTEE